MNRYRYRYIAPASLNEALEALQQPGSTALAGGTDLTISLRNGDAKPDTVVDIKKIEELKRIELNEDHIFVGALITMAEIRRNKAIAEQLRCLYESAASFACYEIRIRATIGGNLANAAPCAQTAPNLLVMEASAVTASQKGTREFPIKKLITGVYRTNLEPGELITGIKIPKPHPTAKTGSFRIARMKGMDLPSVSGAMLVQYPEDDEKREVRFALGSVAATPIRLSDVEEKLSRKPLTRELLEQAKEIVREQLNPRKTSLRASPEYKKHITGVHLESLLKRLTGIKFD